MPASRKKTRKSRSDCAVQGTNDSSIVSKLAMVQAGYFTDPFLQFMVEKRRAKRSPLINRGYYIRAMAMDSLIKHFLDKFGPDCQIFSLGAGFDTTFFRLTSSGTLSHVTSFTEVDFREVANRKARLIVSQSELWTLLSRDQPPPIGENGPEVVSSGNYRLLACDLSDVTLLEACWRHLADSHKPTLLVSECVLTYMSTKSSQAVISAAADYFSNATFLTYEQIYPHDAFGNVMISHFRRLGSPLRGIDTYPTPQLQEQRYLDAGWAESLCVPMTHVYRESLCVAERARIRGLEMFDEYEEWQLKAGHYAVVCSVRGDCRGLYQHLNRARGDSHHVPGLPAQTLTVQPVLRGLTGLARFGHDVSHCDVSHCDISHCDVTLAERDVVSAESTTGFNSDLMKLTISDDAVSKTNTSVLDVRTGTEDVRTSSGDVRTCGDNVRMCGGDFKTSSDDVSACGDDVKTPGGDVRTSTGDVVTTGGDVMTSTCDVRTSGVLVTGGFGDVGSGKHSRDVGHVILDVSRGRCTDVHVRGQNALDRRMFHSASALSPTQILIFGGRTSPSQCFNDVITLNLQSAPEERPGGVDGQSETASVEAWFESVPVIGCKPCERYRHAAILVKNGASSSLFVFGGMTGETRVLSDTWRYDVTKSTWAEMAPLPTPRCSARAAAWRCGEEPVAGSAIWRGDVVLSGGLGEDERPLAAVDVYGTVRDEFKRLETNIQPRYSHTSHVLGDDLYLVGGVSLSYPQPAVTKVNLLTGLSLDYTLPMTSEPLMLHNHCSLLLTSDDCDSECKESSDNDGKNISSDKTEESEIRTEKSDDSNKERTKFLILGGGGNCFSFGTHLNSPVMLTLR